ncbi:hypothetical protein SNE40_002733 [Patella caerulea]
MISSILKVFTVLILGHILFNISALSCEFQTKLRGKWFFTGENRHTNVRIRSNVIIFKASRYVKIRYRCIESRGNIYLLKNTAHQKRNETLCIGFIYVADNPQGEFLVSRMIGRGRDSFIFSPIQVRNPRSININNTCDAEVSQQRKFIYRKGNECRLPRSLLGTWGFTLRQSSSLTMGRRNITIHYLNNNHLTMNCETRDGDMYLFRRAAFYNVTTDAVMCFYIVPVVDDPYYSYQMTRIIAGNIMEGQVRTVPRGQPLNVHQDCDMIDSPARPEYLYRLDTIL